LMSGDTIITHSAFRRHPHIRQILANTAHGVGFPPTTPTFLG
jgi:hypothetical protein